MHAVRPLTRYAFAAIAIGIGSAGVAQASFITTSPDPFPSGSEFLQSAGCLTSGPLSGLCASNVTGTVLSSSSSFVGGNEFVVLNERVTGDISDGGVLVGSFLALGSLDLTLAGRTDRSLTGTFDGTVTAEDYLGTIDGVGLEITLDPSETSTAVVSITLLREQPPLYRIDSFFDLFSQISIEGGAPIPIGGFPITGIGVPEPATLALWGLPLAALGTLRRRRRN